MKRITLFGYFLIGVLLSFFLTGCARLEYHQVEGNRVTDFSASTFFGGKSELAKMRLTNTDKTQSGSIGSMAVESSGTNAVAIFEAIAAGMMKGAITGAKGVP